MLHINCWECAYLYDATMFINTFISKHSQHILGIPAPKY